MITKMNKTSSSVNKRVLEEVDGNQIETDADQMKKARINESLDNDKVNQIGGKFWNIYQVDYYADFELKYYSS